MSIKTPLVQNKTTITIKITKTTILKKKIMIVIIKSITKLIIKLTETIAKKNIKNKTKK